ncbi:MAG: GTP 3',8-cyclase MoaA [Candidatus Bathyarchaeota archaeon]|nr:GTP 3',8-cyclase MoaA [Candidatus Bathyarchaeota archaeon]MDH5494510.1 GTP 3',8-cyclase MoaA [Candidatus Bathyarchaeota archaeon]
MIKDKFDRPVLNLRISVTQRCNLHCPYCHREGQERKPNDRVFEMTAAEIVRLVKIAAGLNISRIKLTGGEPLLRKDILDIVEGIAGLRGLKDLSMTTNGTFLPSLAKDLRTRGLMRVNVSLLSLDADVYRRLMCGRLSDALEGISAAVDVGLYPVKVNMLVLAGVNENEIPAMIQFAKRSGALLQLIELEPINLSQTYYERYHYPLHEVEANFTKQALHVELRSYMQNRRIYHLPDGRVEVIRPTENTEFCAHCTRLRVTSDGKLKPCLMVNTNLVDVLTPLRKGATDKELTEIFIETCRKREPYYRAPVCQLIN